MPRQTVNQMPFAKIYPLLIQKVERKQRTKDEVDRILAWLTGYDAAGISAQLARNVDYETFFAEAPALHPARMQIKGTICGVHVEEIKDPFLRNVRCLDKLIDLLAHGKTVDQILDTYTN